MEWLGIVNQGLMTGKALSKGPEASISIDVINDCFKAVHARSNSKRTLRSLCRLS